ncbi:MAG: type II secretion system F family protein [Deltaproteobacteria bacterium]|jgi:type IV pilus assembly protein PilC|nr:type II secretion system F family protein [Deltaproteobacteria bacterium]MBW2534371.1 type II secretion system F family protein [Deltaproteobacteria bacterium]
MPEFAWVARGASGEVQKGIMIADDKESVEKRLRAQQLNPEKVNKRLSLTIGSGVSPPELVKFVRQFATMIDAGLPLVQCLDILASQEPNPSFKAALVDIKLTVEQGATFSDALRRHPKIFDQLFVNLVHAGEVGGILDTILNRLAVYIEKAVKLKRQIRGALTYPIAVIIILIAVMGVLLGFVIPAFENMFAEFGAKDALPRLTKIVIALSNGFVSNLPFIIPAMVVAVFGIITAYRRPKGKRFFHSMFLKLPIMGPVIKKIVVARFARTLGTLLQSGVPILDSIEICAKSSGNVIVEEGLMYARDRIAEGRNLADPLGEMKVFPGMVVQMVAVGEQTGALDQMLTKIADFYEEETDVAVAAMTSLIEPIMMVVVGSLVGVVLISMYLPIFELAGNIKTE